MFKDSQITRMDPWSIVEEADAMPAIAFPAFVGSGKMGIGLDAAGLQSLPDRLGEHYNSFYMPFHITQADLYVLREGMISRHLYDDEESHLGVGEQGEHWAKAMKRNFMPMGFLSHEFEFEGKTWAGDGLRKLASYWRRDWSLKDATVRTSYGLGIRPRVRVSIEAFTPFCGETLWLRFSRTGAVTAKEGETFAWRFNLNLQTRHGMSIYDQSEHLKPGQRTLLARIDEKSRFTPAEPYAVVYGVASDAMEVRASPEGISAELKGRLADAQTAWLRVDLRRLAGADIAQASRTQETLEKELGQLPSDAFDRALDQHRQATHQFWAETGDIEAIVPDEVETRRRYMLHLSQYILRNGNDHGMGGTVQLLFMHMNGWQAGNFHDHHYIIDGLCRSNIFGPAQDHVRWLKRVMRTSGRPFPWIVNYDGVATIDPAIDRAPMSDANRALLCMRVYELSGVGRDELLRDVIYPIVKTVADHGLEKWFYDEPDGKLSFRQVETDVMNETPRISEAGTVAMYQTVLLKAAEYAQKLNLDADRQRAWRDIASRIHFDAVDGRYLGWRGAAPSEPPSLWFANAYYIAESQPHLDDATYTRTRDRDWPVMPINYPWLNFAAASSDMRLGRRERAEQWIVDSLETGLHGPGYFEECAPVGVSALPPFASAHGSHLTAACEQVVLTDFWQNRVTIAKGLPARLLARGVRFQNLRARAGLLISGTLDERRYELDLTHTGSDLQIDLDLYLPGGMGLHHRATRDGTPIPSRFGGEFITVTLDLAAGARAHIVVEGGPLVK